MIRLKDSVISLAGVVAGQISLFLCVSLIGRSQGPAVLGHFNYLLACGTFAGTLLGFRYELACVSDSPRYAFNALVNVTVFSATVMVVAICVTLAMSHGELLAVESYAFAFLVQQATSSYLNSFRRYDLIAASRLAINGSFLLCLLTERWTGTLHGLDVFRTYSVINVLLTVLSLAGVLLHGRRHGYRAQIGLAFFSENRRFATFILPSTICGSVLTYSLAIIIPQWFDAESAGYFAAAYRLGFFPVSLIGQSLGSVFRRDAIGALAHCDADMLLHRVFMTYAKFLVLIAIAYGAGSALLFSSLVRIFFGTSWRGASDFFYDLVPLFAVQLIYVPLSQIFLVTREQRLDFLFQFGSALVLSSTLYTTHILSFSPHSSVRAFSFAGVVTMLVGLALTYQVMKCSALRLRKVA
ncbi:oligosaccharide flippase family protein [Paraburkholderia sp. Tr-20389]|uniref:lipopolysaccharide biosynthesis protein n=1 Tax=Paraburkholderia sp. Tr-20389 TaxID=2703903 RepID=UPI0019820B53|nr:oligosaccharide flippase family protein [Paraburkholderia sp. Tr-20389]MBN3756906.1 oligosaccharide flippase family protein [Paraburkholderia sp. Tr-20389]